MNKISALLAPLVATCLLMIGGCGTPAPPPVKNLPATDTSPAGGRILFECTPPDARVTVDGEPVATAAEISARGGLTLAPGLHRLEISHPGFRPYRLELNLKDQTETIKVQLEAVTLQR